MSRQLIYVVPEMTEIGNAAELTLGYVNREKCDGCDCTKWDEDI